MATETAKRLHLGVRTVTYRLDRIKALTGYNPTDPAHCFTLQAAVLGAKSSPGQKPNCPLPLSLHAERTDREDIALCNPFGSADALRRCG